MNTRSACHSCSGRVRFQTCNQGEYIEDFRNEDGPVAAVLEAFRAEKENGDILG